MKFRVLALSMSGLLLLVFGIACNKKDDTIANQKQIQEQLQMAGLNEVTVHLDKDRKIATLDGTVNSDQEKATAERIVRATAPKYEMTDSVVIQQPNATNPPASDETGSQKSRSPKDKAEKESKKSPAQTATR